MKPIQLRVPVIALVLSALLLAGIPVSVAADAPGDEGGALTSTLERLSDILMRLEGELSALDAPRAERLEQGLETLTELVAGLIEDVGEPSAEPKTQILRLRLMLHRLVAALDSLVQPAPSGRPGAREALNDLRNWVQGYIDGLTADMDPRTAARVATAAQEMARDLATHIARLAQDAWRDASPQPRIEALTDQLRNLAIRLDRLIRQRIARLPADA
jgi:hypothetical protein